MKSAGKNRFHAYYSAGVIDLHFDKFLKDSHPSTYHVEYAIEEARIMTGLENGTIMEDDCAKLPLIERDVDFILSRVRKRPRYFPKFIYRRLIHFLLDLK